MSVVIRENVNNVNRLLRTLQELGDYAVEIGIFGDDKGGEPHSDKNPITLLRLAAVHEFGEPKVNIPERSFIRAGFDKYKRDIERTAERRIDDVLEGRLSVHGYYEVIGEYAKERIQIFLTDLKEPPLKAATIARKKSSNPLIDTGRLRDSITFRVVRR